MSYASNSLPLLRTSAGEKIDTRPLYIEEWLDSLPYVDFDRTSRLISAATAASNEVTVKPADRLDLVTLYNRPYQYYVETLINIGSQHTLQSIATAYDQIDSLRQIAANLADACRLAMVDADIRKTRWRTRKPPLPAMLMAIRYLSHVLIFSYLKYSPAQEQVWHGLNSLYAQAESQGLEHERIQPPGNKSRQGAGTIAQAYKRTALTSLVDPYHLPFGAVWEIYNQLDSWCDHARITPLVKPDSMFGYFVLDLDNDVRPIPFARFNREAAGKTIRLLDAATLDKLVNKHLDMYKLHNKLHESVQLSSYFAKLILSQMSNSLGQPPKRSLPRTETEGTINLTFGLQAVYYYLNNEQEFTLPDVTGEEKILTEADILGTQTKAAGTAGYSVEQWQLANQGPGGFAAISSNKPDAVIRVGDLVGMNTNPDGQTDKMQWALGVIRWLMINRDNTYRLGIQTIAADITPATIRATTGDYPDGQFRRAILAGDLDINGENSIITNLGLFETNREMVISLGSKQFRSRATALVESSINFEHFTVTGKSD